MHMKSKPLRILHVVRQFAPAVGGLESYVKNMIAHQENLGHRCEVLTLDRVFHSGGGRLAKHEVMDGVPVHRTSCVGRQRFFIPLVHPSFFRDFDIVHVHNTDVFFDYVGRIRAWQKKPVFATTHGGFFHTENFSAIKKAYFSFITRRSCKAYNAIFAISRNDYDIFKGTNENLLLTPNAIAPPGDFTASGPDFIYIGRLAQHKNVSALIKTFAVLVKQHEIVGNLHIAGPEWDVTEASLKEVAERVGIADRVILHGFIKPEKMEAVLKNCGFFVSASSFEGFGMSMLEGMSIGLIPFVQPNGSFRDLVKTGGVGACIDFATPQESAAQIVSLTRAVKPQDRAAARSFAARFSWDELARATMQAYEKYAEPSTPIPR